MPQNYPQHSLVGILQLLGDKVQIVPTAKGKQPRVEGIRQAGQCVVTFPGVLEVVRCLRRHEPNSGQNDGHQSRQLGHGEHILDLHGPLGRDAVDRRQEAQTYGRQEAHRIVRGFTVREERFHGILRKG